MGLGVDPSKVFDRCLTFDGGACSCIGVHLGWSIDGLSVWGLSELLDFVWELQAKNSGGFATCVLG